jgi:hypothetical protein
MSTEDLGGPLTTLELATMKSYRGPWTPIVRTPEEEAEYQRWVQKGLDDYNNETRAVMARPIVGWLHRTFKTAAYRRYRSLP